MPGDTSRAEVAQALAEQLGAPISAALMEVIPPFGWLEIATKSDLVRLERTMDARFDAVDARFAAVDARFDALEARLDAQFGAVDAQFGAVHRRFAAMDAQFGAVHRRFAAMDAQVAAVDRRFDAIDAQFGAVHSRFAAMDARFDSLRTELIGAFHTETARLTRWMVGSVIATFAAGAALVSAIAALS